MCKHVNNFLSSEAIITKLCCSYVTKLCCYLNIIFLKISVLLSILNSLFLPGISLFLSLPLRNPIGIRTQPPMHTQTERNTEGKILLNSSHTVWWLIYLISRSLLKMRNKTRQGMCYTEITHTFGEVWNTRQRGVPSMTQDESYLVVTHT